MIDNEAFVGIMGAFSDKIGKQLEPGTLAMYHDVLAEELTTDEFRAASRVVFRRHRFNTWPEPQAWIDAVHPDESPMLAAGEAFEQVLRIACDPRTTQRDKQDAIEALGPAAIRAYTATGGYRDMHAPLEVDVPFIRRRFVEAYTSAHESLARRHVAVTALSAAAEVRQLVAGVGEARRLTNGFKTPDPKPDPKASQLPVGDR